MKMFIEFKETWLQRDDSRKNTMRNGLCENSRRTQKNAKS